ncbi:hypothetical protein N7478_003519 [Penicillium angulare]|uniref:uncharacterized protein n=1 Tax=Penicillium angulare TaxID=116970 RepID=UPI0025424251|nr:uncharacterized protein N7478_003519 [Penicillium angulare]KAJ5287833.1 hypothetical protein N7478_003519 [Penicillium angulare]
MSIYGCFHHVPGASRASKEHLPQVGLDVHATVLLSTARTTLTQTFINPSKTDPITEVFYNFPLYEDASIVGFSCRVGDNVIHGEVKPKRQAEKVYQEAKAKGHTGAIFEQSWPVRDMFKTRIGNVPAGGNVLIEISLMEELKHDLNNMEPRYTVPFTIAPRYHKDGTVDIEPGSDLVKTTITVDIMMAEGYQIRSVRSPSHPIQVDLGRTSGMNESTFEPHYASVNLRENIVIQEDFVLTVTSNDEKLPYAMLETHPTLPNQQALMISLIPQMKLQPDPSEIVFVIDRSGSMEHQIPTLKSTLKLFIKSLPFGVPFNIVSFGFNPSALWTQSKIYDKESSHEALEFVKTIGADMGGTEILSALQLAVKNGYKDKVLEVLLLTDGEVYNHYDIFELVRKTTQNISARFFTLGIGNSGVSHHLINGIARAGNGFSQHVLNTEALDEKVIRMLRGTLTPRMENISLDFDVNFATNDDIAIANVPKDDSISSAQPSIEPMPLFDPTYNEEDAVEDMRQPLPKIARPSMLCTPVKLPALFRSFRTSVYVLISSEGSSLPNHVTLKADSRNGPLIQKIPLQNVGRGKTIHQLAAKKVIVDLEEGHGWVHYAEDLDGTLIKEKHESRVPELIQTECEYLGERFQVSGKFCSFVAVPTCNNEKSSSGGEQPSNWDIIPCIDGSESEELESDQDMGFAFFDDDDDDLNVKKQKEDKSLKVEQWRQIVDLQEFEGYWKWNEELLHLLRLEINDIHAKMEYEYTSLSCEKEDLWSRSSWTQILATALVGRFLETQASETKEVWELVLDKGTSWTGTCLSAMTDNDIKALKALVEKLLAYYAQLPLAKEGPE